MLIAQDCKLSCQILQYVAISNFPTVFKLIRLSGTVGCTRAANTGRRGSITGRIHPEDFKNGTCDLFSLLLCIGCKETVNALLLLTRCQCSIHCYDGECKPGSSYFYFFKLLLLYPFTFLFGHLYTNFPHRADKGFCYTAPIT